MISFSQMSNFLTASLLLVAVIVIRVFVGLLFEYILAQYTISYDFIFCVNYFTIMFPIKMPAFNECAPTVNPPINLRA
jgi:hypothetical protein